MLISGVNSGAGLNPDALAQLFNVFARVLAVIKTGRIMLGAEAQNTIEMHVRPRDDGSRYLIVCDKTALC